MPRHLSPRIPGATIFVTACLADRHGDLLVRHIDLLRDAVRATKVERPFEIEAFVVLPDHFHAVLTLPEGESDCAVRIGAIKARFSVALRQAGLARPCPQASVGGVNPARTTGEVDLWQRRFHEHHIRTERGLNNAVRYCWNNPVKHGLTDDPFGWPHSSVHRDMARTLATGAMLRAGGNPPPTRLKATLSPAAPVG